MNINEKVSLIREEILEEAREKKERLVREERKKLEEEYQQFQKKLAAEEEEIIAFYRRKAGLKKEQLTSKVILKRKKKKREKLHEFMVQLKHDLLQRLEEFRHQPGYLAFLMGLIKECVRVLESKRVVVGLNQEDFHLYRQLADELNLGAELPGVELKLKAEPVAIAGGVIVEDESGKKMVEYSFETCLEKVKEEMAVELQERILE